MLAAIRERETKKTTKKEDGDLSVTCRVSRIFRLPFHLAGEEAQSKLTLDVLKSIIIYNSVTVAFYRIKSHRHSILSGNRYEQGEGEHSL